jgi:hypothetical protein
MSIVEVVSISMSSFIMNISTSCGVPSDIFIFSDNLSLASTSPVYESLLVILNETFSISSPSLRNNMIIV